MPFTLKLCRNRAGYDAFPERDTQLEMAAARAALERTGHAVLADAGLCLVAQVGPAEVTVFRNGRLMVKTPREDVARTAATTTWAVLGVRV